MGILTRCQRVEPNAAEAAHHLSVGVVMILKAGQTLRANGSPAGDLRIAAIRAV